MKKIIIIILLLSTISYSQNKSIDSSSVDQVWYDLIDAIGNNSPRPPTLIITKPPYRGKPSSADYYPSKKEITIDQTILEICYSFGADSLNALSYILAHELSHHYNKHGRMSYADMNFSENVDSIEGSLAQRESFESEADLDAGFFSHIAGYDALSVATNFLEKVYIEYGLDENLKGYPSLEERKNMIEQSQANFKKLQKIFDTGNMLMSAGFHTHAQDIFDHILNKEFTSREIYNNLGLAYVYEALSLNCEDRLGAILPFKLDVSSRLEIKQKTRGSLGDKEMAIKRLLKAIELFETAIELDENYFPARENLYYSKIALNNLGENFSIDQDFKILLDDERACKYCIEGMKYLNEKKQKKAIRIFKKGAANKCEISAINANFKKVDKKNIYNKSLSSFETINGVDMTNCNFRASSCDFFEKISFNNGWLKFYYTQLEGLELINLKRKVGSTFSCINIQEISTKNAQFKNEVSIYVDDSIEKIHGNHENFRTTYSGNKQYITLTEKGLTFLIEEGKVKKWYLFKKL